MIIEPAPNTFVPPEPKPEPEPEPEDEPAEEEIVPVIVPVPESGPVVRVSSNADKSANEIRAQVNEIQTSFPFPVPFIYAVTDRATAHISFTKPMKLLPPEIVLHELEF